MGKTLILIILLSGCAQAPERFLTPEQDAQMAKECAQGCAVVPAQIFEQMMSIIRGRGV